MKSEKPWVEKYRPQSLSEVVGNQEIISRLQTISVQGNCPHILLSGSPGCGKTTSIFCLARQMLGSSFKNAVLELNASDDRGIAVVRNQIKEFAKKQVTLPPGKHKIIILDEADSMTPSAQQALRRTMELHAKTTRFALACNVSSKIIEPIQSRCAIIRFSRLSREEILTRLVFICEKEKIDYTKKGLAAILFTSEGDLRNAINTLQAAFSGFGVVNEENVYKVCDEPHPGIIEKIVSCCLKKEIDLAIGGFIKLYEDGYAVQDLIGVIARVVREMDHKVLPEKTKLEFLKEIGFTTSTINDGVATKLQLTGLAGRLCLISSKS
eukprot:snap_masked-scaffold_21-processed-gene-3.28-mRNA-1 protein AED:0.01 eAED:0.01 QI:0/-1/0/1/-1/1/1/0/323